MYSSRAVDMGTCGLEPHGALDVASRLGGTVALSFMHAGQRRDRRATLFVVIVSALIFSAAAPFAKLPLGEVWAFIPIYESALSACDLFTAVILFGQYHLLRSRGLLVVAAGYLFTALIAIPHALSFPGLFAPTGIIGGGQQTTVWLYMFWHAGFPATMIAYALLKPKDESDIARQGSAYPALIAAVASVIVAVLVLTLLSTVGHSLLPSLMRGHHHGPFMVLFVASIWAMNIVATAMLWFRRPHTCSICG
jgi:Membrane-associated sensor, integral membrane domain